MLATLVPLGVVTTTLAVPAVPAGVVAVIVVPPAFTETLPATLPPMVTPVAPVKFAPEIVTDVLPAAGPLVGEIPLTVGGATTVSNAEAVLPVPPLVELTVSVVLFLTPAVMPVTFIEKVHEPPALMVPPSRIRYVLAVKLIQIGRAHV